MNILVLIDVILLRSKTDAGASKTYKRTSFASLRLFGRASYLHRLDSSIIVPSLFPHPVFCDRLVLYYVDNYINMGEP